MKAKEIIYKEFSKFGVRCFQKIFPEYFGKEPLAATDRYVEYSFVFKHLPKPPVKVLDVGCSGSFLSLVIAALGYDTYGVDIRNYPILNRLKFDNFTFCKADITNTGFADNFFDVIIAISTIEHIGLSGRYGVEIDSEVDKLAIKEMERILKSKGLILATVPFGKPKMLRPYMRVNDDVRLKDIFLNFIFEREEYLMQDKDDDWFRCTKEEALSVDVRCDRYPLCLMKLSKKY